MKNKKKTATKKTATRKRVTRSKTVSKETLTPNVAEVLKVSAEDSKIQVGDGELSMADAGSGVAAIQRLHDQGSGSAKRPDNTKKPLGKKRKPGAEDIELAPSDSFGPLVSGLSEIVGSRNEILRLSKEEIVGVTMGLDQCSAKWFPNVMAFAPELMLAGVLSSIVWSRVTRLRQLALSSVVGEETPVVSDASVSPVSPEGPDFDALIAEAKKNKGKSSGLH